MAQGDVELARNIPVVRSCFSRVPYLGTVSRWT